jgi:hypothetical protein
MAEESTLDQSIATIQSAFKVLKDFRYRERHYETVPDGVICQHVLTAVGKSGRAIRVDAMMRVYMADGLWTRVEEYVDGRQVDAIKDEILGNSRSSP